MSDFFAQTVQVSKSLWVQTLVHFSTKALEKFDHMVYLYDPSWIGTNSREDSDTLPFAYLEVIKEDVIQNCSVSKKRLILFEPDNTVTKTTQEYRKSAINIVADNVVNEPVQYKLECLIPMNAVSRSLTDMNNILNTVPAYAYSVYGDNSFAGDLVNMIETTRAVMTTIGSTVSTISKVLSVIRKTNGKDTDYNKRSLLSMARRRAILRYKPWNTWETKTVVITGISINKAGTEDDFYRASVELQEMPILYIGKVSPNIGNGMLKDTASVQISKVVKAVFDSTIGKMER